jgi:hypothetical protein
MLIGCCIANSAVRKYVTEQCSVTVLGHIEIASVAVAERNADGPRRTAYAPHRAAKAVLFESHPTDNDMSLDFIVEDPLVSKRKRSTRACELCRMRKVRCDGLSPQCTRCRQDFKECSYAMTRKRGPKSSNRKSSLPRNAQKDIDSEDSGKLTHITDSTFCKE